HRSWSNRHDTTRSPLYRLTPFNFRSKNIYASAFCLSQKSDDFCMPFPSRGLRKLASLPDHLVRQHQEVRGNGEPECLGGLEVDDQLEFRRLLHRQGSSAASSSPLRHDTAHRADDDAERARAVWHAAEIGGAHMVRERTPVRLVE